MKYKDIESARELMSISAVESATNPKCLCGRSKEPAQHIPVTLYERTCRSLNCCYARTWMQAQGLIKIERIETSDD